MTIPVSIQVVFITELKKKIKSYLNNSIKQTKSKKTKPKQTKKKQTNNETTNKENKKQAE